MMPRPLPAAAGIFGWPVAQSKSPRIHRFWLGKLGIDGDYSRFPVHPDNLGAAIKALPAIGLRGVNVTMPHKAAVMAHLDDLDASARAVGAVNTVHVTAAGLIGHNTDVAGIAEPIARLVLAGRPIVILGAGGAARAALVATRNLGATVTLVNRSADRAAALLVELGIAGTVLSPAAPLPAAALLINATSLGMTGAPPLDIDLAPLANNAHVFDCVYAPLDTPLLQAARARGLATIDGLAMLIGQAATAFTLFYGAPAPRQFDAELRALLVEP